MPERRSTLPAPVVVSGRPVTLVGGGQVRAWDLRECLFHGPRLVAADGGADQILSLGRKPEVVIGDMDSISPEGRAALSPESLHPVAEQESTDFEKCLTRIQAPLLLALGVTGQRVDHALSVFNTLMRFPDRRALLVSEDDVVTLAPPSIEIQLVTETRVSLFPMGRVCGQSSGLFWPISGIDFAPGGRIGTSNRAVGPVRLTFSDPAMLLILPRATLPVLVNALLRAPAWPSRG